MVIFTLLFTGMNTHTYGILCRDWADFWNITWEPYTKDRAGVISSLSTLSINNLYMHLQLSNLTDFWNIHVFVIFRYDMICKHTTCTIDTDDLDKWIIDMYYWLMLRMLLCFSNSGKILIRRLQAQKWYRDIYNITWYYFNWISLNLYIWTFQVH